MEQHFRFKTIGEILKESGVITAQQLNEGLEQQQLSGVPLGAVLVRLGFLTEEQLLRALGTQTKTDSVRLEDMTLSADILARIPGAIARLYNIVPIAVDADAITVATSDPLNFAMLDDLRFMFNGNIKAKLATAASINDAIKRYYGTEAESVEELFSEISQRIPELESSQRLDDIEESAAQLPIIKLINLILVQAINKQASDIHFEPFQNDFKIRYRLDGVLYDVVSPPKTLHLAITSRIKIMANLNIAETRLPQDGRALVRVAGRMIDLRVSTLPTIFGESVVIRILDKATVELSLHDLGFEPDIRQQVEQLIKRPYGIILSTGPTGCGKTTTQYAALSHINHVERKIITVEDPVEFDVPGLIQVSVQPKINLSFPVALRHILRQDPDIIMVGEIRDAETVQMAIHASLTGHLVFSTLHTNDAPSAITRLIDMGVEPFLIASAVEAVLAQRLLRCICPDCKGEYTPSDDELQRSGLRRESFAGMVFYRGAGCDACNHSGYRGRLAIFELLVLDEDLRSLILDRAPVGQLREKAVAKGMRTLREDGVLKVRQAKTTLEELMGVTAHY